MGIPKEGYLGLIWSTVHEYSRGGPMPSVACLEEVGGIEPPSKKVPTRGVTTCRNQNTPEGWGYYYCHPWVGAKSTVQSGQIE